MFPIDQRGELLRVIGECLDSWGSVEFELANLYMILLGVKRDEFSHPLRAAYEAVVSLEVRLAMTEAYAAADQAIPSDYLLHFRSLKSRVLKLYKKRHELAHFKTIGRLDAHNGYDGGKMFVRPYFTWSEFVSNTGTELDIKQLHERHLLFVKLQDRVLRHIQHVGSLRKLPLEYYAQAGGKAFPPLGPEDLNQAVQPPPPQSSPA